jgi:tetratricopeptide (TPR) repeat protein
VILAGLAVAGAAWQDRRAAARLPVPPASGLPPAIAAHLQERYGVARRDPTSAPAVGALCRAYHADMLFDHADRCYAVAESLRVREPEALRVSEPESLGDWRWTYLRSLILLERGGGSGLQPMLQRVTSRAPQFAPAWLRLGDVEFKAGRPEAARAAWERARQLGDPVRPPASPARVVEVPVSAYASLGMARLALAGGAADEARVLLEQVVAQTPGFGPGIRLLADAYRALGRDADAARAVYRAGRLPPFAPYADPIVDELARESRHSTLLLRLASEATLSANGAWSEHLTRRAVEFEPDNPDAVLKLARVLRTFGRNAEALGLFERYHQMVPGDFQGLAHIGSCLSAMGRLGEAESYLRRALVGADDPITRFNLGLLLVTTGRVDEGIREYERALERDPMYSDARGNLAAALARRGDIVRATSELAFVVEHDPDNALARTNLGLLLMTRGRTQDAAVQLEEALRLAPGMTAASEALDAIRQP